jgi:hypothetical protein
MEAENIPGNGKLDRVFIRNQDIVSRRIAGELFLVPVKGKLADMESIFTLTSVAEYIWDRLDGEKRLDDIRNEIVARFDVGLEQADADLREFIAELLAAGLIHPEKV